MIKNKFVDYLQRIWYVAFGSYAAIGFKFYFRRWQVNNYPKMSRHEPVIYVSNHQNAFLDALAIIYSQNRHPIFLVRANIFASKLARIALRGFNMFPIYRQRDGGNVLEKNEKIIQDCIEMLKDGRQPLAIFVEGNHSMMRTLRPMKKGVARIAFSALEQSDFKMKLKIIPVGIYYSKHTRGRSDLLVNFGEPIMVNEYLDIFHENHKKAYLQLTKTISAEISKLIVNIADRDNYEEIEKAWISEKIVYDNMVDELHNDQQIIARLTKEKEAGKVLDMVASKKKQNSVLWMMLGFPAFLYGALNNLPFYFIMNRLLDKVVTDIHFYGSIKIAGGAFIGGIMFLLQAIGVYALTGANLWIALVYFVTLPFFGIFAYDYYLKYYTDEPNTTSSADLLKGYK
jgi:1-acyl-sn-glycerol-3-phosphate acyltransferase